MRDEMVKCSACNGRGYHHCACWPADCICGGYGEDDCEECGGEGWTWPDDDMDTLIERAILEGQADRMLSGDTGEGQGDG